MKFGRLQPALGRFSLYFAPSIFSAALSIVMLPIATRVVGPMEYGIFALITAYTGFGSALATIGGNYVITHRWLSGTDEDRKNVVSTVCILALGSVITYGFLLFALWPFLPGTHYASTAGLLLAVAAMIIGQLWFVAVDVLTIRGNAGVFAATAVISSILSAATLLVGLFYFSLGVTAFFLSQVASAIVSLAGAFLVLREYLDFRLDRRVLRDLRSVGIVSGVGNLALSLQTALERSLLSLNVGITQLGIYSNAQAYRGFVAMPLGAVSKSIWPATLSEARDPAGDFKSTKEAWDIAYIGVTFAGIFFATLGDRLIGVLTHEKFTEAYLIATFWMVYLLVQNSGKPQTGILYALGGGKIHAQLVVISTVVGMLAMAAFIPFFGVWGAVAAATFQQVFLRAGIQTAARRLRYAPFQDGWAVFGAAYITATFLARRYFGGPLEVNVIILAVASALLLVLAWRPLSAPVHRILLEAPPVS